MKKIIILSVLVFSFCTAFAQYPLYRYYNPKIKKHYYTIHIEEYGQGARDWILEGVSCVVFTVKDRQPGTVPLFRFSERDTGDHYYTTRRYLPEEDQESYDFEGTTAFIFKYRVNGSVPLFEYYSPSAGDHFYTTDRNELGPGREGYVFDTVVGFVLPKEAPVRR
jgi:hypothetical protein